VGVRTTIPFHLEVLGDSDFTAGDFDIGWVDRRMPALRAGLEVEGPDDAAAAAVAAVMAFEEGRRARDLSPAGSALSPWAAAGRRAQMQGRQPRGPWA
jgi:acetyl/propionyl-CoA carboxylase alpha subunit